jgi:hypothetical protein
VSGVTCRLPGDLGGPAPPELLLDSPGAVQIQSDAVAWEDGNVVLHIPAAQDGLVDKASWHGCPEGWFCFYQHDQFRGRRLQFRDCPSGGKSQWLRNYGFHNQTTSWVVNRSLSFVNVNDDDYTPQWPNGRNLWNADAWSSSSNVGNDANDKADWFICYG